MVSLMALLSNCPPEGAGVGFITTLTIHGGLSIDAQTIQLQCNRHGLRGLEGLLAEVADSYKQLTFGPLFL